ncbi:MAG: type II and III secretion system protein family protein [Desulfobaccales bacterium]|jgi:pilus assembly protein CpaC
MAARWVWLLSLSVLLWGLGASSAAGANLTERMKSQEITQVLHLQVGQSKVLRTAYPITRISVADPEIADIILISEKELYVNGLHSGVTNLSIWGKGRFTSATVTVEADLTLLKEKLHQILPGQKIAVQAAGDTVVLSGEVTGPVAQETALSLANSFSGGKKDKVVNLLHIGGVQQVMVEVRLAEIDRTVIDQMGINWIALASSGNIFVQQINALNALTALTRTFSGTSSTQSLSSNIQAIASFKGGGLIWTVFFNILKQNNLGRVLAEPNLVTTSGQQASFLAGGEYPVPSPQPSGGGTTATVTVEYKPYGVTLNFTPTVLDGDMIAMKLEPEVSELDPTVTVQVAGFSIQGFLDRKMSTHLEVHDGQTIAMAGLLKNLDTNVVNKFPWLGDVPVLGNLFRSSSWQKQETELVVLVTPHLVKPVTPGTARMPDDKWIDPNDYEKYLLGWSQGQPPKGAPVQVQQPAQPLPAGFGIQKP